MPVYLRRAGRVRDILSTVVANTVSSTTSVVVTGTAAPTRPSGAGYTRWEDIVQAGDVQSDGSVDITTVLARAASGQIVTFPEGVFAVSGFRNDSTVFQAGFLVPQKIKGIVGSGKGTLGGTGGTIFTMVPGSSTSASSVPAQGGSQTNPLWLMKSLYQTQDSVFQNFQVRCTDQGHNYGGFQIYNTGATSRVNTVSDILVTGWQGDNGAPPGETFGFGITGLGAHQVTRLETDSRRAVGGVAVGATGFYCGANVGATFSNCYSHHCRTANFAAYQAFNGNLVNCNFDAASAGSAGIGNGGVNFERCGGWTLTNPQITGRTSKVHVTHSSDAYSLTQDGTTYSTTTTKGLTIINPTWNDTFGSGYLYVQSWTPYGNTSTSYPNGTVFTPATVNSSNVVTNPGDAPLVVQSDGVTHIPYVWAYSPNRIIP